MSKVKVSICCVTFNHQLYIEDTIRGFLKQDTSFPIEIVIADDASTDSNKDIIRNYSDRHPNLINFLDRNKNLGMMGNYVDALKLCSGEYIAICEGDDYWIDPLKLQKQVDFLEEHPEYVMTYHNVIAQNIKSSNKKPEDVVRIFSNKNPENIPIGHRYHTSSMVYRNVVQEYPKQIYEVINTGDSFLQFLISRHGKVGFQKNIYPNIRRRNPESLYSYKDAKTKIEYSILLYEKLLEIAETKKEENKLIKSLLKANIKYIKLHWNNKDRQYAIKILFKNIKRSILEMKLHYFIAYILLQDRTKKIAKLKNKYLLKS